MSSCINDDMTSQNIMTSSGGGSALISEISSAFLVCGICSGRYTRPKSLSCLHTYCEDCLEVRYLIEEQERPHRFLLARSLSCPACGVKTALPPGGVRRLPDNLVVTQLSEVIGRRRKQMMTSVCEICSVKSSATEGDEGEGRGRGRGKTRRDVEALSRCLDCAKLLCGDCAELHRRTKVTRSHALVPVDADPEHVTCKLHADEPLRFYCEPCATCVCVLCTFQAHGDHVILSIEEGLERHVPATDVALTHCRRRAAELKDQLSTIQRAERDLKNVEDRIHEAAMDCVTSVRRHERRLVTDLKSIYGEQAVAVIAQKTTLADRLRSLEQTSDLVDALLKVRSVEFLIVREELTRKLTDLLDDPSNSISSLPESLSRTVSFVSPTNTLISNSTTGPLGTIILSPLVDQSITTVEDSHQRAACTYSDLSGSETFHTSQKYCTTDDFNGQSKQAHDPVSENASNSIDNLRNELGHLMLDTAKQDVSKPRCNYSENSINGYCTTNGQDDNSYYTVDVEKATHQRRQLADSDGSDNCSSRYSTASSTMDTVSDSVPMTDRRSAASVDSATERFVNRGGTIFCGSFSSRSSTTSSANSRRCSCCDALQSTLAVPRPVMVRRRSQTDRIPTSDSWTETESVPMQTTVSTITDVVDTADRSTLTTIQTATDRATTTECLIVTRTQETFTTPPPMISAGIMTERVRSRTTGSQHEGAWSVNKTTMTRRPLTLERETNTITAAMFDCGLMTCIKSNDDKATSTKVVVTVDMASGVCQFDEFNHLSSLNNHTNEELSSTDLSGLEADATVNHPNRAVGYNCQMNCLMTSHSSIVSAAAPPPPPTSQNDPIDDKCSIDGFESSFNSVNDICLNTHVAADTHVSGVYHINRLSASGLDSDIVKQRRTDDVIASGEETTEINRRTAPQAKVSDLHCDQQLGASASESDPTFFLPPLQSFPPPPSLQKALAPSALTNSISISFTPPGTTIDDDDKICHAHLNPDIDNRNNIRELTIEPPLLTFRPSDSTLNSLDKTLAVPESDATRVPNSIPRSWTSDEMERVKTERIATYHSNSLSGTSLSEETEDITIERSKEEKGSEGEKIHEGIVIAKTEVISRQPDSVTAATPLKHLQQDFSTSRANVELYSKQRQVAGNDGLKLDQLVNTVTEVEESLASNVKSTTDAAKRVKPGDQSSCNNGSNREQLGDNEASSGDLHEGNRNNIADSYYEIQTPSNSVYRGSSRDGNNLKHARPRQAISGTESEDELCAVPLAIDIPATSSSSAILLPTSNSIDLSQISCELNSSGASRESVALEKITRDYDEHSSFSVNGKQRIAEAVRRDATFPAGRKLEQTEQNIEQNIEPMREYNPRNVLESAAENNNTSQFPTKITAQFVETLQVLPRYIEAIQSLEVNQRNIYHTIEVVSELPCNNQLVDAQHSDGKGANEALFRNNGLQEKPSSSITRCEACVPHRVGTLSPDMLSPGLDPVMTLSKIISSDNCITDSSATFLNSHASSSAASHLPCGGAFRRISPPKRMTSSVSHDTMHSVPVSSADGDLFAIECELVRVIKFLSKLKENEGWKDEGRGQVGEVCNSDREETVDASKLVYDNGTSAINEKQPMFDDVLLAAANALLAVRQHCSTINERRRERHEMNTKNISEDNILDSIGEKDESQEPDTEMAMEFIPDQLPTEETTSGTYNISKGYNLIGNEGSSPSITQCRHVEQPQSSLGVELSDRPRVWLIERGCSPISMPILRDAETSTFVTSSTRGSNTPRVDRVDVGVNAHRTMTSDSSTSTPRPPCVIDKETCTPTVLRMHKNVATHNEPMVDKQTGMSVDVTAAYRQGALLTCASVVSVSRGTSTNRPLTADRSTSVQGLVDFGASVSRGCSPQRASDLVHGEGGWMDRGTSPVRILCFDKAVMVTKGEALEPSDRYQAAGRSSAHVKLLAHKNPTLADQNGTMRRPKPQLDCIAEGMELEEEEEEENDFIGETRDEFEGVEEECVVYLNDVTNSHTSQRTNFVPRQSSTAAFNCSATNLSGGFNKPQRLFGGRPPCSEARLSGRNKTLNNRLKFSLQVQPVSPRLCLEQLDPAEVSRMGVRREVFDFAPR